MRTISLVGGLLEGVEFGWHELAQCPIEITFHYHSSANGIQALNYGAVDHNETHSCYVFDKEKSAHIVGAEAFDIVWPAKAEVVDAHRSHLEKINAPSFAELVTKWQEYLEGKGPEPG